MVVVFIRGVKIIVISAKSYKKKIRGRMASMKKMFLVLVKPFKVFTQLKERPVFLIPLTVFVLLALLFSSLNAIIPMMNPPAMPGKMSEAEIKKASAEMRAYGATEEDIKKSEEIMREGPKPATDEEIARARVEMKKAGVSDTDIEKSVEMMKNPDKAMAEVAKLKPTFSQAIMPIAIEVVPVLLALLLTIIFFHLVGFSLNVNKGFAGSVSIVSFAWMPLVIRYLLQIARLVITKTPSFSEAGLAGVFKVFPSTDLSVQTFIYAFLQKIDIFSIWSLVLLSVGVATVFGLSYKKSAITVSIYFILSVFVSTLSLAYGYLFTSIFYFLPF
jgi:hypothetical protein